MRTSQSIQGRNPEAVSGEGLKVVHLEHGGITLGFQSVCLVPDSVFAHTHVDQVMGDGRVVRVEWRRPR